MNNIVEDKKEWKGLGGRDEADEGKGTKATHKPGQAAVAGDSEATRRPEQAADATVVKLFGEELLKTTYFKKTMVHTPGWVAEREK